MQKNLPTSGSQLLSLGVVFRDDCIPEKLPTKKEASTGCVRETPQMKKKRNQHRICKRSYPDKNEACTGYVRETPQKNEAITGCVRETSQTEMKPARDV